MKELTRIVEMITIWQTAFHVNKQFSQL